MRFKKGPSLQKRKNSSFNPVLPDSLSSTAPGVMAVTDESLLSAS
jgi:hypothetical protein